jgi:hypothetical protein
MTLTQKCSFAALAICTTAKSKAEEPLYEMECFGTRHFFIYPIVFLDQLNEENLLAIKGNPVALAALAVVRIAKAKKNESKRFQYIKELLEMIKAEQYSVEVNIGLGQFIEGITNLSTSHLTKEFKRILEDLFSEVKYVPVKTPMLKKVLSKKSYEWGKAEGKIEVARVMLARKMKLDVIADLTGLTEEDIKSLLN